MVMLELQLKHILRELQSLRIEKIEGSTTRKITILGRMNKIRLLLDIIEDDILGSMEQFT